MALRTSKLSKNCASRGLVGPFRRAARAEKGPPGLQGGGGCPRRPPPWLRAWLERQVRVNEDLESRLEELDMNGRLSSLILTCDAFRSHPRSADIEQEVVTVLNKRVSGFNMTTADLQGTSCKMTPKSFSSL